MHSSTPVTPVTTRTQLTLFVTGSAATLLHAVRQALDPVQHSLIATHVTLCREDEIGGLTASALGSRLSTIAPAPLALTFGPPEYFAGHGVLLPCVAGAEEFHRLRVAVLGRDDIRRQDAHITLAHPRNPRAPGNAGGVIAAPATPLTVDFTRVSLVEQHGSQPWEVLTEFAFGRG